MHCSAGKGVFEDGEDGEVFVGVGGGVGVEEGGGIVGVRGDETAWEFDFLGGGFGWGEELTERKGVLFCEEGGGRWGG